ncbi:toxin-antitoxin system YwqK family antitoxin [Aquimarina sp. SS2-1]|uniref:toxin-antitoxin system YwqK family antitoxin n=1 Tax=Aquimarina besae TaxID=3342247 RepID=UPI00366BCB48
MRVLFLLSSLLFFISCQESKTQFATKNICTDQISLSNKNGFTKNYYANSINLESIGHYNKGIQQGFWKYYYRNGNIKAEGHYEQGKKQGYWKEYHKNGVVKSEGHIDQCEPTGYWKFYDKKENLINEINY